MVNAVVSYQNVPATPVSEPRLFVCPPKLLTPDAVHPDKSNTGCDVTAIAAC